MVQVALKSVEHIERGVQVYIIILIISRTKYNYYVDVPVQLYIIILMSILNTNIDTAVPVFTCTTV